MDYGHDLCEEPLEVLLIHLSIGVTLWILLYQLVRRIFSQQSAEFSSRVVAATHAFIVTTLAYLCYKQGPDPLVEGAGDYNTVLQVRTMEISISYFLYDFGWCIYFGTEPIIMLLHHICSIASIGIILVKGHSGAEAVMGLGTMEASNPYLQIRWFLRTAGYNNSPLHTFVEWNFLIIFLMLRLGIGSRITYCILKSPDVSLDIKLCTLSLFLISLAFVYHMFLFVKKKYFSRLQGRRLSAISLQIRLPL